MNYSTVSHVGHESFPPASGGYPGPPPPPPPPPPGYDQDYYGPGYQSYFSDNFPPQGGHMHYNDPTRPFNHHSNSHHHHNGLLAFLKASLAALCCCCLLEQCCCCNFW